MIRCPRNFAYNLRLLRLRAGITQVALAARVGCAGSAVSAYESGHKTPGLGIAVNLARALNTPLDRLCGERLPPC